jgi:hypothetical protein
MKGRIVNEFIDATGVRHYTIVHDNDYMAVSKRKKLPPVGGPNCRKSDFARGRNAKAKHVAEKMLE